MNSFHQSRGKRIFELFCLLGLGASLAGAGMQTGASALLAASGATLLYALVQLFGLKGSDPLEAVPVPLGAAGEAEAGSPVPVIEPAVEPEQTARPAALAGEEEAKPRSRARKPRAPRKGASRRTTAPAVDAVTEDSAPEEPVNATGPSPVEDLAAPVEPDAGQDEPDFSWSDQEPAHSPPAPLFEPEPFVRQQRAIFGRKAG